MNINVRIRRFRQRQAVTIPKWQELTKLSEDETRVLAAKVGVEYTDRMGTLSAIHQQRG